MKVRRKKKKKKVIYRGFEEFDCAGWDLCTHFWEEELVDVGIFACLEAFCG